ncbi:MAG TPA: hypothetical protein VMI75_26135, partial [Polyangiaceae bacterium]|nr:hypothetical protein [Polyangiaceae bacterium]
MVKRGFWVGGSLMAVGTALLWSFRPAPVPLAATLAPAAGTGSAPEDHGQGPGAAVAPGADDPRVHAFRLPTGDAPGLACEEARAVVAQTRGELAYVPDPVDSRAFADAAADWLDPYGLWSVAPDSPVADAFDARAAELLADLESRGAGRDCSAARALGADLVTWVDELRAVFDAARADPTPGEDAENAASAVAFEGATVTRPARALAATLGRHIGALDRELGAAAQSYADAARARYFPALGADGWARVVLAAAVRAYVPTIDPHGAWAPLDEESSVYEVDLESRPPVRLWEKAERTAVGIRVDSGATPPLVEGDVVLSLADMPTAGLSFEQMEQLGFAASDARPAAKVVLLRSGERAVRTATLDGAGGSTKAAA